MIKMSAATVEKKFEESECVPAVIDNPPHSKAEVSYGSGNLVELGNTLTPTIVQNPPSVVWDANKESFYTLLMTDPDAPSRSDPKWGEWRHWLVVNIPGCEIAKGQVISEYIGAGPPEETGLHRYIILVFKQNGGEIVCKEPYQPAVTKGRNNTSTRDLVNEYNLGIPVAGNFFQARWDEYVPKLYAKLASNEK